LIEACLRSQQIQRARLLFQSLTSTYPSLSQRFVDIHVHNKFLKAFVDASNGGQDDYFRQAFQWFLQFRKQE
jgi:hypothetical protein